MIRRNFLEDSICLLCIDHPTVIKKIANIFVKGCSIRYKRLSNFFITSVSIESHCSNHGEIEYRTNPINSWICEKMRPNKLILKLFTPKSLPVTIPLIAFKTATKSIISTKKDQYEWVILINAYI